VSPRIALILVGILIFAIPTHAQGRPKKLPKGSALKKLVTRYLEADEPGRSAIREELDRDYGPLERGKSLDKFREDLLKAASKVGPKLRWKGNNYWYDKKSKRGRYIASGGGKSLWFALHGGGVGQGDAGNLTGAMGGLSSRWIFPEVLEKTEHGWTTSGTEEFIVELIRAAKRSGKVDPDQIYITGHSMGGFGTWTLGAHHCDVFAGAAAYAGAPTPLWKPGGKTEVIGIKAGVLPSYFQLPLFFFQSLDDLNVPPAPNVFANKALLELKAEYPDGFNFRYEQVDDRGHAAPAAGYKPSQKWIMSHQRVARPERFLWQPVLKWKRHMYWLYWRKPIMECIVDARRLAANHLKIEIDTGETPDGMSVFLGEPLVDPAKPVKIEVNGELVFEGQAEARLSTLFLTLPRHDPKLLFATRVDLKPKDQ
jgi:pimeloyl-ACP methyl ester carboxylesterase